MVEIFLVMGDYVTHMEVEAGLLVAGLEVEHEGVLWRSGIDFIVPEEGPVRVLLNPSKRGEA